VPFAAGNFTAAGSMTWTVSAGQVPFNRYTQFGKTLLWSVYIAGGVLGGTASNAVYITLPNGLSATGNAGTAATGQLYDGVHQPGFVSIDATGPKLRIQKQTEGTFGLGPTYIRFTVVLEVL
jgi:hypothetical protein